MCTDQLKMFFFTLTHYTLSVVIDSRFDIQEANSQLPDWLLEMPQEEFPNESPRDKNKPLEDWLPEIIPPPGVNDATSE